MRVKKIKIPDETLNAWKLNRYYGDITDILAKYPEDKDINRTNVSNALQGKDSPQIVIKKITKFYETV